MLCVAFGSSVGVVYSGGSDGKIYHWTKSTLLTTSDAHKGPVYALGNIEKVCFGVLGCVCVYTYLYVHMSCVCSAGLYVCLHVSCVCILLVCMYVYMCRVCAFCWFVCEHVCVLCYMYHNNTLFW
jgi:hypothetical protein